MYILHVETLVFGQSVMYNYTFIVSTCMDRGVNEKSSQINNYTYTQMVTETMMS